MGGIPGRCGPTEPWDPRRDVFECNDAYVAHTMSTCQMQPAGIHIQSILRREPCAAPVHDLAFERGSCDAADPVASTPLHRATAICSRCFGTAALRFLAVTCHPHALSLPISSLPCSCAEADVCKSGPWRPLRQTVALCPTTSHTCTRVDAQQQCWLDRYHKCH